MTPQRALVDALAYLSGQRGTDAGHAEEDAATILKRLAERGFGVVPMAPLTRGRYSPHELRAKREGLRLTAKALGREAGIDAKTIRRMERPGSRAHLAKIEAVSATLDRLESGSGVRPRE